MRRIEATMDLEGTRAGPYVRELAEMMALFDTAGYAADPSVLRDTFGVSALEEWADGDR